MDWKKSQKLTITEKSEKFENSKRELQKFET